MCSDYQRKKELGKMQGEFSHLKIPLRFPKHNEWGVREQSEIRPSQEALVVRRDAEGAELTPMRWGMVPFFHKGKDLKAWKAATFNARAETVKTAASFRGAFQRRRCLVVADAWYEWQGEGKPKPMYRLSPKGDTPMAFAGLWDRCTTADCGDVESFTIVTQPAGSPLNTVHDRAPVVLFQNEWSRWLDASAHVDDLLDCESADRFDIERYYRPEKPAEIGALI